MTAARRLPRLALQGGPRAGFNRLAAAYLKEYADKITLAVEDLEEDEVWRHAAAGTNSIANLILHLCGNLSLWVLSGLGEVPFERDRAGEFAADRTVGRGELVARLNAVVESAAAVFTTIRSEELERQVEVQGYTTSVLGVVFHAVEHMSYHTGQIVAMAKELLASRGGLEFYPHHSEE